MEFLKFNKEEKKIFECRLSGVSIDQVDNLDDAIDTIVIRVSSILGIDLPRTEVSSKVLNEECGIFIKEFGYSNLTIAEIMLAFRMNLKGITNPHTNEVEQIKFTGMYFNVSFLSQVLSRYKVVRDIMDAKIKNKIDGIER